MYGFVSRRLSATNSSRVADRTNLFFNVMEPMVPGVKSTDISPLHRAIFESSPQFMNESLQHRIGILPSIFAFSHNNAVTGTGISVNHYKSGVNQDRCLLRLPWLFGFRRRFPLTPDT
jgi:hypothetical protein